LARARLLIIVSLHSAKFRESIVNSSGRNLKKEDIESLVVCLNLIKEQTKVRVKNLDNWTFGKHGIRIHLEHDGKVYSKTYLPEIIQARGWTTKTAVKEGLARAGFTQEISREILDKVQLTRFETFRCDMMYSEYIKDRNPEKKRFKHLKTLVIVGVIVTVIFAIVFLRFEEHTYSADYEDFLTNYDVLEIPRDADIQEVKKAYRQLSLKWHPDRNRGCEECPEKYMKIAEAYSQLMDYDKGILKLVNRPTRHEANDMFKDKEGWRKKKKKF